MAYQGQSPKGTNTSGNNRNATGNTGSRGTHFQNVNTPEVQTLSQCLATCKECGKMCLEEGQARTAIICNECAEICDLALKFKCCNSEFANQALDLCGQICKRCASECGKANSAHCQECADVCKRCAEVCSSVHSYR